MRRDFVVKRKNRLFLVILGGLVFIMLATAVGVVGGKEKKYDFGGRTITLAAWWEEYKSKPGGSEREDLRLKREAEVSKKYNVKIDYVTIPWGEYLAKYITTIMAGDAMADIVSVQTDWFYPTLLLNNFCLSLSEVDVFDFKKPDRKST